MSATVDFATYIGPIVPFRLLYFGTEHCQVTAAADGQVVWEADLSTDDVAGNTLVPTWDASALDSAHRVYLLVALKGGGLKLYRQMDMATLPALIGSGTYAILYRVTNKIELYQQVG